MKKILVLADIHGRVKSLGRVLSKNTDISLVLVAGDLTNFGDEEAAAQVLAELEAMTGKPPIAIVPGNCDPLPARRLMERSGHYLDGGLLILPFCRVAGAGGGLRRAGMTSFERTEDELRSALETALADLASIEGNLPLIVLTHSPPYGTNADLIRETHAGSVAFAELMSVREPELWVCGHIHESPCISLEDGTLVVNPGPCATECFAVIELKEGPGRISLAGAYLSN
ncbi:MAG: metallophosphoesterase [Spirochaetes bacterium]|nr:metallophosphoesterase [Spirochaetota bacterium]